MAPRKKKRKIASSGQHSKVTQTTTETYTLTDNVTELAAKAFVGNTAYNHTKGSLNLSESVDDSLLIAEGHKKTLGLGGFSTIIFTADRGRGDGIMPSEISKYQKSGERVIAITFPGNMPKTKQILAARLLPTISPFKVSSTYADRFRKIHVSFREKDFVVQFERTNGKSGIKTIKDVLD